MVPAVSCKLCQIALKRAAESTGKSAIKSRKAVGEKQLLQAEYLIQMKTMAIMAATPVLHCSPSLPTVYATTLNFCGFPMPGHARELASWLS